MALRAGFAAAALLGIVTTFGTALWVGVVLILVGLVVGLGVAEGFPRPRRGARS